MKLAVVLRDVAESEFDEAFDWYDARRIGLGAEFAAEVQRTFDSLAANPRMHRITFADVRMAVVRRFYYCIYYRPHVDRIEVIAVFHPSRDPAIWQSRV